MILAAALLLLAQDVPAPAPQPEGEDIVVRATLGRTTMLFDKGRDGKLRNCRVMVSSGSQRRDTAACQATPVCYEKTAEQVTDCVEMAWVEDRKTGPLTDELPGKPTVFAMPKLVQPKPVLSATAAGPADPGEKGKTSESQRVKLPPLPKPPGGSPIIIVKAGDGQDRDRP